MENKELLEQFNKDNQETTNKRVKLIKKLCEDGYISVEEALLLSTSTQLKIFTKEISISSGARIITGTDNSKDIHN